MISTTFQPWKWTRVIRKTFQWTSLNRLFCRILPYSMTSSRSKCLPPVPFASALTPSRVDAYFQGERKRICTKPGDRAEQDYTIMSWAHLHLPKDPKSGEMFSFEQSSQALQDYSETSVTGRRTWTFFFLSFFMSLPQAAQFLWWLFLLNTGLWQHDREKKQRASLLTCSPSFLFTCQTLFSGHLFDCDSRILQIVHMKVDLPMKCSWIRLPPLLLFFFFLLRDASLEHFSK